MICEGDATDFHCYDAPGYAQTLVNNNLLDVALDYFYGVGNCKTVTS